MPVGQSGTDIEHTVPQLQTEKLFAENAEIPSGRTGVPSRARFTRVVRAGVNIGGDNKGLGKKAPHIVIFGEKSKQNIISVFFPTSAQTCHGKPYCRVGVLTAVFPEAGTVTLDIARVSSVSVKRGSKELYNAVITVEKLMKSAVKCCVDFAV